MEKIYNNMTRELLIEKLQAQEVRLMNLDRVIGEVDALILQHEEDKKELNKLQGFDHDSFKLRVEIDNYKTEKEKLEILKVECINHIEAIKGILIKP